MKLDIDATHEMIRDILLREYSSIQEQLNVLNALLHNPDYRLPIELVQEKFGYYTELRDAMRIVVNYYCAPSEKVLEIR